MTHMTYKIESTPSIKIDTRQTKVRRMSGRVERWEGRKDGKEGEMDRRHVVSFPEESDGVQFAFTNLVTGSEMWGFRGAGSPPSNFMLVRVSSVYIIPSYFHIL